MKKDILLILITLLSLSCKHISEKKEITDDNLKPKVKNLEKINNLKGTKWVYKIADDCINFYEFINKNTFKFYSCEMEDEYDGVYYIKNDTLYTEEISLNDNNKIRYLLIQTKGKLKYIKRYSFSKNHLKWVEDNFLFDDILFEKQ